MARSRVQKHAQEATPGKEMTLEQPANHLLIQTSSTNLNKLASYMAPQSAYCEAKPITPPQSAGVRGFYRCIVDYDHQPFSITWSGSPEYPDLKRFPQVKNVEISSVYQNSEMASIWRDSKIIDYGSYASIRITEHNSFPILKLAHVDELSIKLIQHEFNMLADLTKLGLPVVDFDQQPIFGQWDYLWLPNKKAL